MEGVSAIGKARGDEAVPCFKIRGRNKASNIVPRLRQCRSHPLRKRKRNFTISIPLQRLRACDFKLAFWSDRK